MKIHEHGYWMNPTNEGHGHDEELGKALVEFFREERAQDILDVGCGDGYYTNLLSSNGFVCHGVDGNPNTPNLVGRSCYVLDLTEPLNLGRYDWVLSLEVGEHIPEEYEDMFLKNLDKSNVRGIVMSWAIRGQGGDGHVNCKDNEEIVGAVCSMGYEFDERLTNYLRNRAAKYPNVGWWFKNTLLVFRRKK